MIKEVKKYTDDEGKSVTAYIPLEIEKSENKETELIAYEGQVGVQTPMGVAPIRFPFPDNYTLEQCFENFKDIADIEVEKVMKEAEERAKEVEKQTKEDNLIVTPDQMRQQTQSIPFPQ